MITKEMLEAWRAQRRPPEPRLELTPPDEIRRSVDEEIAEQRERNIAYGEATLHDAHERLRENYDQASHGGLARSQFIHASTERMP